MKLINNWQNAHKALSVVLPTLGSIIMLLIFCLQKAGDLHLIPEDYVPFVTTVLIPLLAWIGRVIPQVTLLLGDSNGAKDAD